MNLRDSYIHGGSSQKGLLRDVCFHGYGIKDTTGAHGTNVPWSENSDKTVLWFETAEANSNYILGNGLSSTNWPYKWFEVSLPDKIHSEALWATGTGRNGFIHMPDGGVYNTYGTYSITGLLTIKLPTGKQSAMISFFVDVFNYQGNTSTTYKISGYLQSTHNWECCTATPIGTPSDRSTLTCYFGYNDNRFTVQIGEATTVWKYPQVRVRDILFGYANTDLNSFKSGWEISIDATALSYNKSIAMSIAADKVKNALTIGGNTYDGSKAVTINETTLANMHTHDFIQSSNGSIKIYATNENQLNFGGTSTSNVLYIGYTKKDNRPQPTSYKFSMDSALKTSNAILYAKGFKACVSDITAEDYLLSADGGTCAKSTFALGGHNHGNILSGGTMDTSDAVVITDWNKKITTETYADFTKKLSTFTKGTSSSTNGVIGVVPAPNYNNNSGNRYLNEKGSWKQISYKELSDAPDYYWADQRVTGNQSYSSTPTVKTIKISTGTEGGSGCTQQYDSTNKCLKFIFS